MWYAPYRVDFEEIEICSGKRHTIFRKFTHIQRDTDGLQKGDIIKQGILGSSSGERSM